MRNFKLQIWEIVLEIFIIGAAGQILQLADVVFVAVMSRHSVMRSLKYANLYLKGNMCNLVAVMRLPTQQQPWLAIVFGCCLVVAVAVRSRIVAVVVDRPFAAFGQALLELFGPYMVVAAEQFVWA